MLTSLAYIMGVPLALIVIGGIFALTQLIAVRRVPVVRRDPTREPTYEELQNPAPSRLWRIFGHDSMNAFAFVITLVVFFLAMTAFSEIGDALAVRSWPTISGKITNVSLQELPMLSWKSYSPFISYSFKFADATIPFGGTRITPNDSSPDRAAVEALIAKYTPGQEVTVYYSPDDRLKVLLEPVVGPGTYAELRILAVLLVIFIVWCQLYMLGQRKMAAYRARIAVSDGLRYEN